jgi:hypothetical protein
MASVMGRFLADACEDVVVEVEGSGAEVLGGEVVVELLEELEQAANVIAAIDRATPIRTDRAIIGRTRSNAAIFPPSTTLGDRCVELAQNLALCQ